MSRIGIIAALPAEAKCLYQGKASMGVPVEIDKGLFLCLGGIGHELTAVSTMTLLNLNVDALISWGIAGAINKSLKPGDLLVAESIIGVIKQYAVPLNWVSNIKASLGKSSFNIMTGTIASNLKVCASVEDKYNLHRKTTALAVDMESAAMAKQAVENNIDFVAIRAIADTADMSIPEVVVNNTDKLGNPVIPGFVYNCIKSPGQFRELIRLRNCYKKALNTLRQIAPDLKKQHFAYTMHGIGN